jgi:GNAT superfamily N-acetyltransferase
MLRNDRVFCFEPFDVTDPLVRAAEQLYEATQQPDERIPWGWIARSVKGRVQWRPGQAGRHLLLAMPEERMDDPTALAGFAFGTHIPGYGGYISYIGVADQYRKRGVGTRLFEQMFKLLAADAGAADEPLPFIVWESHKPELHGSEADWKLWEARTRLFQRVGGQWLDGLPLYTPNYDDDEGDPVKLELFVKLTDSREFIVSPDDELHKRTLASEVLPRLRLASEANHRPRKLSVAMSS